MGGGIFSNGGVITLTNDTFTGNTASGGAGEAGLPGSSSSGGAGQGLGGAVFARNGTLTLYYDTISLNTAAQGGRGVYALGDATPVELTIDNTIIGQGDTNVTDLEVNSINNGQIYGGGGGDLIRTINNTAPVVGFVGVIVSTADPDLAPLASYGGPTQTMALNPGGPAIAAGDPPKPGDPLYPIPSNIVYDQRGPGYPRTLNGTVSIGAFEYLGPISQTITFGPLANQTYGVAPITLGATASSTLPVSFAVTSGPATVSGDTLTVTGAGTVVVEASQVGNALYAAAVPVDESFTVSPILQTTLSLSSVDLTTDYAPGVGQFGFSNYGDEVAFAAAVTDPSGNLVTTGTVEFLLDGTALAPPTPSGTFYPNGFAWVSYGQLAVGTYNVEAIYSGASGYASSSSLAILQYVLTVNASVTPSSATKVYGAADPALTGSTSGFVGADGVTASFSRTSGETVADSPYTISATLSPPSVLSNYVITYNTAPFTITAAATTTTVSSLVNPSVNGQDVTFQANVANASDTGVVPTGTVQFIVGGATLGGPVTLSNGAATSPGIALAAGSETVQAVYSDPAGNFSTSTGVFTGQVVNPVTTANLQTVLATTSTPTLEAPADTDLQTIISAINGLAPTTATITVNLGSGTFNDSTFSPPAGVTVVVIGNGTTTTFVGHSPAFQVTRGSVSVSDVTFMTATDAPTILVSGGSLTLRDDTIEESTGFTDAAISLAGGTLDLGTAGSPGGNVLNINGTGEFVHNTTAGSVPATGDTYEVNGAAISAPYLSFTTLSSSGTSVYGQSVTLTAGIQANTPSTGTPTGSVDFLDTTTGTNLGSVFVSGGSASLITSALSAGSHLIVATYGGDGNFTLSLDSLTQSVTPAPLTVTANPATRLYGAADPTVTATISGFVLGQTPATGGVTGGAGLNSNDTVTSPVGHYTITPTVGTLGASNYAFTTFNTGTLSVTPAPLSVTAASRSKVYGVTLTSANYTGTLTGVVAGDNITASYDSPTGDAGNANVAGSTYAIIATLNDPGNRLANYNVTNTSGALTVTPAPLSVTAASRSKVYGVTLTSAGYTGTLTGVVAGDNITASYDSPTGDAGNANVAGSTYAIIATLNDPGNRLANYNVTNTSGALTVTPAPLSVTAASRSKVYGVTLTSANYTGTLTGVVAGDNITASYDSPTGDAGNANVAGSTYAIIATLNDPGNRLANYNVTNTSGALTVTSATSGTVVISSANGSVYGQAVTFTATVTNTSGGNTAVPTGTVQFVVDGSNFGAAVAVNATGLAVSLPDTFLSGASHTVEAVYTNSDGNFLGSNSTNLTQAVQTVGVEPDPSNPALTDLFIGSAGHTSNDQIQVNPVGSSRTGSTGVMVQTSLNGVQTQTTYSQSFTALSAFLQNGNDTVQLASSLTINAVIKAGNGNDTVTLGNGNDTVTLGNGNDNILAGNGTNTVTAGAVGSTGNIQVGLGNGANNLVTLLGNGNDSVQLGNGNDDSVSITGNGNDSVQLGNGNDDSVSITGNGNDSVQPGNGNDDSVSITGNGNDSVQPGNGNDDSVSITGNGNDSVQLGNGNDDSVSITGNGNDSVQPGNGNDDSVSITGNGNDSVQLGNGNDDSVSITGNGNDSVQLGNGNDDSVSITGNGNDSVQLGNGTGDSVSIVGNGNEDVQTGNGTGKVHVAGTGHKTLKLGSGWNQV